MNRMKKIDVREGRREERGGKRQTATITIFKLTVSILETPPSEVTWDVQDSCTRLFKSDAAAQPSSPAGSAKTPRECKHGPAAVSEGGRGHTLYLYSCRHIDEGKSASLPHGVNFMTVGRSGQRQPCKGCRRNLP